MVYVRGAGSCLSLVDKLMIQVFGHNCVTLVIDPNSNMFRFYAGDEEIFGIKSWNATYDGSTVHIEVSLDKSNKYSYREEQDKIGTLIRLT